MAQIKGIYLREPPKSPDMYTSKAAALLAEPHKTVADRAFPKDKIESVKNAASRVNSDRRGDWPFNQFFGIWEYADDAVLKIPASGEEDERTSFLGFAVNGEVIGEDGSSVGILSELRQEPGVDVGGWVLLIGVHPNVPKGWERIVYGTRRRRRTDALETENPGHAEEHSEE
jgi:hypothetical protein